MVHGDLVLGSVSEQMLIIREGNIGRCCGVSLVVGGDFNTIVLPDANISVIKEIVNWKGKKNPEKDIRVGCAQIDTNGFDEDLSLRRGHR